MIRHHSPFFKKYSDYPNSSALKNHFLDFAETAKSELGFAGLSIVSIEKMPYNSPNFIRFSSLPKQWLKDYEANNLAIIDPVLRHGLNSTSRLVWDENTLLQDPLFAKIAKKHKICSGICQSMRDTYGMTHVVLLVDNKPVEPLNLQAIELKVSHLVLSIKEVLESFFSIRNAAEYVPLSDRELEILRWAASGKTAVETAEILKLSERTVNFHLNNCSRKLNVRTKTQALLKAITLNIL